jgi:hypothetical protein
MKTSEAINEIAGALSKAQGLIRGAVKDAQNPFFKSSYADLSSISDAIREPLSKNGLSYIQTIHSKDLDFFISTRLMHSSGQWIEDEPCRLVVKDPNNPQAFGSAVTYFRRYCLTALIGVSQVDDDAQAAVVQEKPQTRPVEVKAAAPTTAESKRPFTPPPQRDSLKNLAPSTSKTGGSSGQQWGKGSDVGGHMDQDFQKKR